MAVDFGDSFTVTRTDLPRTDMRPARLDASLTKRGIQGRNA